MVQLSIGGLVLGKLPVIKSIQHGSVSIAEATASETDTITSVDTNNSLILYNGKTGNDGNIANASWFFVRLELTNSTTVTATRDEPFEDAVVTYCVIEFYPGIIKSNQSGSITMTGTSNTATINAVNTGTIIANYQVVEFY